MPRLADFLRRGFTALLVVSPLLSGADACTARALAGGDALACMERVAVAGSCRPAAGEQACAHCVPGESAPTPQPQGPTCCDLKPTAPSAGEQPALAAPGPAVHPVSGVSLAVVAPVATWRGRATLEDEGPPPGESPPPLSPRAPPRG